MAHCPWTVLFLSIRERHGAVHAGIINHSTQTRSQPSLKLWNEMADFQNILKHTHSITFNQQCFFQMKLEYFLCIYLYFAQDILLSRWVPMLSKGAVQSFLLRICSDIFLIILNIADVHHRSWLSPTPMPASSWRRCVTTLRPKRKTDCTHSTTTAISRYNSCQDL